MNADELITAMLNVATETEADALDDMLVRCGYWWECRDGFDNQHGFFKPNEPCDLCGRRNLERR